MWKKFLTRIDNNIKNSAKIYNSGIKQQQKATGNIKLIKNFRININLNKKMWNTKITKLKRFQFLVILI